MNSKLEERLLKKLADKEAGTIDPVPTKVQSTKVNSKIDVTGKPQSLEELMKALGLPVKKKVSL